MNYFLEPFLDYMVSEVPKRNIYTISSGENNGTKRETPSLALGICEFYKSYF